MGNEKEAASVSHVLTGRPFALWRVKSLFPFSRLDPIYYPETE
jgi:hypothetical protein